MNDTKTARVKRALGEPGGCSSWTCCDPDCKVPPGSCHWPGCELPAARPGQSSVDKRWIADTPALYCTLHGAPTATGMHAQLVEEPSQGYISTAKVAELLHVATLKGYHRSTDLQPALGTRCGSFYLKTEVEEAERQWAREGDGRRQRWQDGDKYHSGVEARWPRPPPASAKPTR